MKTIVIVCYKIVKNTIDILHNETIWVKWEFFWKKNILVFPKPFVKLLATVKHNVSSLIITGIRLQLSRVSRQIGRGIISYDSCACLVLVESYYNSRLKRPTRRLRSSAKITTTARMIMDNNNCESINHVFKKAVDLDATTHSQADNQTIERRSYSTYRLKTISLWNRKLRTLWKMQKT